MKRYIILLLLLGHTVLSYATDERLVGFQETNLPEANEQLRGLQIENQINEKGKLDLNSKKIENLATPTASTDATTKAYVDITRTVAQGGTGVTTLTDGGILLGSGTAAITALGVASNGQIPIGDGTTDPVLANISGVTDETDVTNGAGTITIGIVNPLAIAKGGTGSASTTYCNLASNVTGTLPVANGGTAKTAGVIARIKTGLYTGDGNATKAITGVGFQPKFLMVIGHSTPRGWIIKTDQDTTYASGGDANTMPEYVEDVIISLDSDGFTVGDGTGASANWCNTLNVVHTYIAFD